MPNILHDKSDEELLEMLKTHSKSAFTELVHRHTSKFYALAYRMLMNKDVAEELVQEAFTKLWLRPDAWNENRRTKFTTWFYRVVINLCLDRRKKDRYISDQGIEDVDVETYDHVEHALDTQIIQREIDSWIEDLPPRQKIAINLVFYQGINQKEAAKIMNTNLKTVESLLSRAKQSLRNRARSLNYGR
jgi:RNA polymerase sigma-70 factor, ECF subfamily